MNALGHDDEGRDSLITAALAPPAEARAAWDAWVRSGADADHDGIAQHWMPLIGWNLRHADVDDSTRAQWRAARVAVWAWNVRLLDAARPALEALVAADIPITLLKGAALANGVHEPGLRLLGDVDVLVRPEDAARARAILLDAGWMKQRPIGDDLLPFRHALDLLKPPHGAFDLHWYLVHENCWTGADLGLWQRRRPQAILGVPAAVLDPADQLLHACVHGPRWSPVHSGQWIADAAAIIRAHPELAWSILIDEASRRRLGLQILEALLTMRRWSGVPVPDQVLADLRALPASARDRLECRFKGRPVVSAGGMFVIWCGWRRVVQLGGARVPWAAFLAAAAGLESRRRLLPWFAQHARARLRAHAAAGPRRGASTRERLTTPPTR